MLNALTFLHQRLGVAMIAFALILAVWGTAGYLRTKSISPAFRSSFLLLIALTAVQGLVGAIALTQNGRPKEILHVVYGIFAVLFLPGLYLYAGRGTQTEDPKNRAREAAFLAIACWVVLIAYGRGFMTGS